MGSCSLALYHRLIDDVCRSVPGLSREPTDLHVGCTPRQYAGQSLINDFLKKFRETVDEDADARALEKFRSANEKCGQWELAPLDTLDDLLIGEFRREVWNFFTPAGYALDLTPLTVLDQARLGPGTSRLAHGEDFYTKLYSSPMSSTSSKLYNFYSRYVSAHPRMSAAESFRSAFFGNASIVKGSRLSFVPKRTDISRTICTEPLLNMYYQLGVGEIILDRLRQVYKIDLADQPDRNRKMALIGSVTQKYGTLDLASASDSISLKMLEEFLPSEVLMWLKCYRSPETEVDGRTIALDMISSMGNGYTFPLETSIFACVVAAVYRAFGQKLQRNTKKRNGNFAVFGDDIIVVKPLFRYVERLLVLLGFSTNRDKSFNEGFFRESCGLDVYQGNYVRPVFLKRLKTKQDLAVVANRLNDWSSMTGIPLPDTLEYLDSRIRLDVPLFENDDAGIKVPSAIKDRSISFHKDLGSPRYRKWVARNRKLRFENGMCIVPRGWTDRLYNSEGHLLSAVAGYVTDDTVTLRQKEPTYQRRWSVTPNWDYVPPDPDYLIGLRKVSIDATVNKNLIHRYL